MTATSPCPVHGHGGLLVSAKRLGGTMPDPAVLLLLRRPCFQGLAKLAAVFPGQQQALPLLAQATVPPVPVAPPPGVPGVPPAAAASPLRPLGSLFPQRTPTTGQKATALPGTPGHAATNVIDQLGGLDASGRTVDGNNGAGIRKGSALLRLPQARPQLGHAAGK